MSKNNKRNKKQKELSEQRKQRAAEKRAQPNDGKPLEKLVRYIESALLPKGLTVSANKREGNAAEFDIVIEGPIGSLSIKWLFECRDRPSEGPAPGSWMEQLYGRRDRFSFDKVVAVSTTGFAADAADFARKEGIILRHVARISDISKDIEVKMIQISGRTMFMEGNVRWTYKAEGSPILQFNEHPWEEINVKAPTTAGDMVMPLHTYVFSFVRAAKDCERNGHYTFEHPKPAFLILPTGEEVNAASFEVSFRCETRKTPCTAISLRKYSDDQRLLGRHTEYEGTLPDGKMGKVEIWETFENGDWRIVKGETNLPAWPFTVKATQIR